MRKHLALILNQLTLTIPYFITSNLFFLFCRQRDLLAKSPLRFILSPVILPDGNQILWSWSQNPFWLEDITQEIFNQKLYEHFFSVKENEITLDVGANVGLFSLKASKVVGDGGTVVAFEPEENNYKTLLRNLRINKCKNVRAINAAVSNFDGKADFLISSTLVEHKLCGSKNDLDFHFMQTRQVNVTTIETVVDKLGIDDVHFLKIDAEGAEFEVLNGAKNLLVAKRIKKLSVAVYHSDDEEKIIADYLRQFGYKVLCFRSKGLCDFNKAHVYGYTGFLENDPVTNS